MLERLPRTVRWIIAALLALLMSGGVMASAIGWWAHQTLLDTDTWVETVGDLATEEPIPENLSDVVSARLIDWVDAGSRLETILPPVLSPLSDRVAEEVNLRIIEETDAFFQSEEYETIWRGLNRTVHSAVIGVLRDDLENISTAEGVVTVDLEPFVTPILDRVVVGLRQLGAALPETITSQIDVDGTLAEMIAQYEAEGLPPELNSVVVYESESLGAAQDAVLWFDRLVFVLPVVTLLLAGLAVWMAPNRILMGWVVIGLAALDLIFAFGAVQWAYGRIVDGVEAGQLRDVVAVLFTEVTQLLNNLLIVIAVVLVLIAIGLFVLYRRGSSQPAGDAG